MVDINELKEKYPLVDFERVDRVFMPRHEDAFYPFGQPKGVWVEGDFIRIKNPMGGADAVRADNIEEIYWLASWHQSRAEDAGFGA